MFGSLGLCVPERQRELVVAGKTECLDPASDRKYNSTKAVMHIGTLPPLIVPFCSHEHTSCIEKQGHPSIGRVPPQLEVHMDCEEGRIFRRILAGRGPAGDSLKILDEGAQGT